MGHKSDMHVGGESDGRVIPSKCPNKSGSPLAEDMEGRRPIKENIEQATAPRTQSRISELSDLLGVRKAARKDKWTHCRVTIPCAGCPFVRAKPPICRC